MNVLYKCILCEIGFVFENFTKCAFLYRPHFFISSAIIFGSVEFSWEKLSDKLSPTDMY